jgi:hypothetical protein
MLGATRGAARKGKSTMARSKYGKGSNCVFTAGGKKVRCFETESAAKRVAAGFNKNRRMRVKFVVRKG